MTLYVSKDFSETPGGRLRIDGIHSGEQFREELLEPKYLEAINRGEKLTINLDGGYGYTTSFLEESFGGLARIYGEKAADTIEIISEDEPQLAEDIKAYLSCEQLM